MSLTSAPKPKPLSAGRVAGLLLALALGGCNDNITCVFTTGCRDLDGSLGSTAAIFPTDGEFILDAPPEIVALFPESGRADVASSSPLVITFSESLNPNTIAGAFELTSLATGFPGPPLPFQSEVVVGDGRVLILFPPTLPEGELLLRASEEFAITDLTGQPVDLNPGAEVSTFGVDPSFSEAPRLVTVWPPDGSADQGATSEIIVVLDRPVDEGSVDDSSFIVQVDGADPAEDPEAEPLMVTLQGIPIQETRAYRYRSEDAEGTPVPLGTGVSVQLTLSPAGNEIVDGDGDFLATVDAEFQTADFSAPLEANILSLPNDAIGSVNLTPGDINELLVQVDLVDAQAGDILDVFLFGTNTDELDPLLIALAREQALAGPAPILVAFFTLMDLDLTEDGSIPPLARFADGPVAFAFRLRRGARVSPLRLLDVDPVQGDIQDPVLDTVGPTILELQAGSTDFFSSDQRDIVITGRASESVRCVDVMTDVGGNGTFARVIGSDQAGNFVAAPVPAGLLPPGDVAYTVVAFDSAMNPSPSVTGTFRQLGAVGPGALTPGDPVTVEVFDAETLEPLSGARVLAHADDGDGVSYPFLESAQTGADGTATVTSADATASGTLITVEMPGFDLLTLHGITSGRLSLPLTASGSGASAMVSGSVTSTSDFGNLFLNMFDRFVGDSRRLANAPNQYPTDDCVAGPLGFGDVECPYGPEPIVPNRIGAQTFLAGEFDQGILLFNPPTAIQAFDLLVPVPATATGTTDSTQVVLPFLLNEPGVPADETPFELNPLQVITLGTTGLEGQLDGDPVTSGDLRVSVEALVPGVARAVPVGIGVSFQDAPFIWNVRMGVPGAVGPGGFFGRNGIVDPDAFMRVELRDMVGNRSLQRPRISNASSLPTPFTLAPPGVPQLLFPAEGASSGATSFTLRAENTIVDLYGEPGLYRAQLAGPSGRGWTLWTVDPPDAAGDVLLHLPDLSPGGATGLAAGTVSATLSLFAWPSLDTTAYLWSDVEREHDLMAESRGFEFDVP